MGVLLTNAGACVRDRGVARGVAAEGGAAGAGKMTEKVAPCLRRTASVDVSRALLDETVSVGTDTEKNRSASTLSGFSGSFTVMSPKVTRDAYVMGPAARGKQCARRKPDGPDDTDESPPAAAGAAVAVPSDLRGGTPTSERSA